MPSKIDIKKKYKIMLKFGCYNITLQCIRNSVNLVKSNRMVVRSEVTVTEFDCKQRMINLPRR